MSAFFPYSKSCHTLFGTKFFKNDGNWLKKKVIQNQKLSKNAPKTQKFKFKNT